MIGGVKVPKGAVMTIYTYMTHRNPALWPDPERFDPERFRPERAAGAAPVRLFAVRRRPRICIGQGFAMAEASGRHRQRGAAIPAFRRARPHGSTDRDVDAAAKDGVWVTAAPRERAKHTETAAAK